VALWGSRSTRPPAPLRYRRRWEPREQAVPRFPGLRSQACTQAQVESPEYRALATIIDRRPLIHRKQWEWCFILQALDEHGCIGPGRRGLGFGVGIEPLTPYLASHGCEIVATDLGQDSVEAAHWAASDQHAENLDALNQDGLCPPERFAELVRFRPVDMRHVPDDLRDFDFTWSSCAMEHLGTLEAGAEFFLRQIECLRPGGVGVHTTEYNVSSNDATVDAGSTVLYRRVDLERLAERVRDLGHEMELTFGLGRGAHDRHLDRQPFTDSHLKIEQDGFAITSFGLIVRRAG
jgi:2-polyprenyl-3-methyl-5-hydroxy-6-metoxy-1,4-benzoquinol methylase